MQKMSRIIIKIKWDWNKNKLKAKTTDAAFLLTLLYMNFQSVVITDERSNSAIYKDNIIQNVENTEN